MITEEEIRKQLIFGSVQVILAVIFPPTRRFTSCCHRFTCAWQVRGMVYSLIILYDILQDSHALIRDIFSFTRVIKQVITFITEYDNPSPRELKDKRKVFVGGASLGGWVSLEYGLDPNENAAGIIAWVCPQFTTHF